MTQTVFPFTLHANQRGASPHEFRPAFLASKPEDFTWYAYDVTVLSRTSLRFRVYGMRHPLRGGVGDKIAEYETEVEPSVTLSAVERRILQLAQEKRDEELREAETRVVRSYAALIRHELDAK